MGEILDGFERNEDMEKPLIIVERITDGLGYGEGAISSEVIDPDARRIVHETISTNPDIIVKIDVDKDGQEIDDDGCGDGRAVMLIKRGSEVLKRSLHRAKVFGGALAMAAAGRIGAGLGKDKKLEQIFDEAMGELDAQSINYGAHDADHVQPHREGLDSGCGAIDGAPEIIRKVVEQRNPITDTLKVFGFDGAEVEPIMENFAAYVAELPSESDYSGARVMSKVKAAVKIVKTLTGPHLECAIVINTVRGYTVDQGLIRAATDGKAQVFAFDSWRLTDIAAKLHAEDDEAERTALISEFVYTLGVAAHLTPGDLPVYIVRAA